MPTKRERLSTAGSRLLPLLLSIIWTSEGRVRWPTLAIVTAVILTCSWLGCNDLLTDEQLTDVAIELTEEGGPQEPPEND